jgi:hypothetical protein
MLLKKIFLSCLSIVFIVSAYTAPAIPYRFVTTRDTITPTKLNKNTDTIYAAHRMFSDTVKYNFARWGTFKDSTIHGGLTADSLKAVNYVRSPSFVGNLVGNVVGDLSGNVSGNVTGNLTGTADSAKGANHAILADSAEGSYHAVNADNITLRPINFTCSLFNNGTYKTSDGGYYVKNGELVYVHVPELIATSMANTTTISLPFAGNGSGFIAVAVVDSGIQQAGFGKTGMSTKRMTLYLGNGGGVKSGAGNSGGIAASDFYYLVWQ